MTEKYNQLANQIVGSLINNMMNVCEPNPILKMWFEKEFVKEDYELDWDKRLDENLQWKNKGDDGMTEKRFTTDNGSNEDVCLVDNITGKEYESNFDEIVELLNELHEENRALQRHLDVMRSGALTDDKRIKELYDENEQLKSKNRGLQSELQIFKEDLTHSNLQINKLTDENEQLKNNIKEAYETERTHIGQNVLR